MKKLMFLLSSFLVVMANGLMAQTSPRLYDRSALSVMMVYHPDDEFAYNIVQVFDSMPTPDKYDNHNVGLRILDYNEFYGLKPKNETYAFRSSDPTIAQYNEAFYKYLQENNHLVQSWHFTNVYWNYVREIVKKRNKKVDVDNMTIEEMMNFVNSLPKSKQNKVYNDIYAIPQGLHKAKYGKVLSASHIETNALAIEKVLNENQYGKMMVQRWFNLHGNTPADAVFSMDTIIQRGHYNATHTDIRKARQTARGTAALSDMGEQLLKKSFILVNDITYVTSEEKAQVAGLVSAIAMGALSALAGMDSEETAKNMQLVVDVANSFTGFNVKTHSYLYQLEWNDEVAATFYDKYYTDTPDSARILAFLNDTSLFKMKYVAHEYEYDGKAVFKGQYDRNELIRMNCTRSMDKNIAKLQVQYEDFKIKTPIISLEQDENGKTIGYNAEIGLKEGVTKKSTFQVVQKIYDEETGRTTYRRIATLKPKGAIWDNRYNAVLEQSEGSELKYTTLKKVSGGEILPGMLIVEGKFNAAK